MTLWVYKKKPAARMWLQRCLMKTHVTDWLDKGPWAPSVLLDLGADPATVKEQRPDFRGLGKKQEKRNKAINGEKKF